MESADIWFELGNTCHEMGLLDKAVQAYLKAIEQKLPSSSLYGNLASIYVQQGKFLEAIPLYQKSLEYINDPKDLSLIWGRIGNVYRHLNEYGKSIQAFQKADEYLPVPKSKNPGSRYLQEPVVNEKYLELWKDQNIDIIDERMLSKQLGVDPNPDPKLTLDPMNNLDNSGPENSGENPDCENEFLQENASVWNELGLILFKVGAYDDAIDAYQKAITLEPEVGYLYSNLGQVYVIQGKLAEAVDQYEKSIKHLTNNKDKAVSWTRLGDIYRQLGQNEMALPAYQLADLFNQTLAVYTDEYRQVNLELIKSNTNLSRGMEDINDLVLSIRRHGIIQPLIVCSGKNEPGKYILIAGRRRLEAARLAGLKEVPVIIRRATNQEILELSINENIHTTTLNQFELAKEYCKLADEFDLTIEEISAIVGRSCHSVANTMKILEIPEKAEDVSHPKDKINGQSIINRSLAEINYENLASQSLVSDGIPSDQMQDVLTQSDTKKYVINPDGSTSPRLWYLEPDQEAGMAQQGEEIKFGEFFVIDKSQARFEKQPSPQTAIGCLPISRIKEIIQHE